MTRKDTAVERAYSWVRERLLDGTFRGGSFIDEATVCAATGVSRTPAREAFNRLEGERFITLVPRRGAQVRSINSSDLYDAFHGRFMVESFAAAEFCASGSEVPADMLKNLDLMDEMSGFASTEETLHYMNADKAFHLALVQTLNNRSIIDFFESLWRDNSWAALTRGRFLRSENWLTQNRTEHHAIFEALKAHDFESARKWLRTHFELSHSDLNNHPG